MGTQDQVLADICTIECLARVWLAVDDAIAIGDFGHAKASPLGCIAMSLTILRCGISVNVHPFFRKVVYYFGITPSSLL